MKAIESLVKTSPIPFTIFNKQSGEMLIPSHIMEQKLGYSEEQLNAFARNEFSDIMHPDDFSTNLALKKRLDKSEEGEILEAVMRLRHVDGHYLSFHFYCSVFERDAEGNMIASTVFAIDLTDQLKVQAELGKALEKIDKMAFANSHELRAPVATIIGIVNMLESSQFMFDHQENLVHLLIKTVNKLDDVIRHVNDVASDD